MPSEMILGDLEGIGGSWSAPEGALGDWLDGGFAQRQASVPRLPCRRMNQKGAHVELRARQEPSREAGTAPGRPGLCFLGVRRREEDRHGMRED